MTEKEKRDAGTLYDPADPLLLKEREKCKSLCHRIHLLSPEEEGERCRLYRELFGKAPERFRIEPLFWCDYGYNIFLGENCFLNHGCVILDCAPVTLRNDVFVGPNTGFYTAVHPINPVERLRGLEYARPIEIGNNVWIGGGVQILPGVKIGDNAVIGAGSVVTGDIPANAIAVGNPCRVHRIITEQGV